MDSQEITRIIETAGLAYEDYMDLMRTQAGADPNEATPEAAEMIEYTKLNLHRSDRIGRTWQPGPELMQALGKIRAPQRWLVLTEPWCGDSAQCLPYIAHLAAANEHVQLHIVLRDSHLDLMDCYLTNGKRSIPRLVVFDADETVLGQWGPRPKAAQVAFEEAKGAGLEKPDILEKLHLWYGRNRGAALAEELTELLQGINAG